MINYWWVTRPKRKLNSIPEVLSTFSEISLNQQWEGQRDSHLSLEEALEGAGLKRVGERRDHTGGGARTYKAWLVSLGLIFTQKETGQIKLTLAGEAIMSGESPIEVLKAQVLKYQFPSSFSIGRGVDVSRRFKIHPFMFLLKLMMDDRLTGYISQSEMANVIIVEAEDESEKCYEHVVSRILQYRDEGDLCLSSDFNDRYGIKETSTNLADVSNTMMNWLEYTQLTLHEDGKIFILPEKKNEVSQILAHPFSFVDRPEQHEYFQRKYGIDPKHNKDTRNLLNTKTITPQMIAEQQIAKAYISLALSKPIAKIDKDVVDYVIQTTGFSEPVIVETLRKKYPHGSIGTFMTEYYEMAFKGTEEAVEFEKATTEIFREVFGFNATHLGQTGSKSAPDVLLLSNEAGYQAIIDNKAYSKYSISGDHHNRMVHNYIENIQNYSSYNQPIGFFTYISGGFASQIDKQLESIHAETGVHGSGMTVSNMIKFIEEQNKKPYSHNQIKDIFSVDRQILMSDINR